MNLNFEKKILFKGNWLQLNCITKLNKENMEEKNNEYISRVTKKSFLSYDEICIIPLLSLKSKQNKSLVLIAQFRPPVNAFALETIAGLAEDIDPLKDIERELNEESGFTCENNYIQESPIISGDSSLFNIKIKTYTVEIDGDKEENLNPKQNLEDEENIIIHFFDINKSLSYDIINICSQNRYILTDKIWFMMMGLDFN